MTRVALVAGGGDLPRAAFEAATAAGSQIEVLSLVGALDWCPRATSYPPEHIERLIGAIRAAGVEQVAVAGYASAVALASLARLLAGAGQGAGGPQPGAADLARRASGIVESLTGARLVGVHQLAPELLAEAGHIAGPAIDAEARVAAADAVSRAAQQGLRDIGQAIIAFADGALMLEDAEGTDALLARAAASEAKRPAILAKAAKPQQMLFADMPVIGPATVRNAARARVGIIAVEAGRTMVVNHADVQREADAGGVTVIGIAASDG